MKRIITAREQVQLLSAWRKIAEPGMDWREVPEKYFDTIQRFEAPLETGHRLVVWGMNPSKSSNHQRSLGNELNDGWLAHIDTSGGSGGKPAWEVEEELGPGYIHPVKPVTPYDMYPPHQFPSPQHAMEAVEQAYPKLFPPDKLRNMKAPQGGDSGVDYTQYTQHQQPLDDDYGDIFGDPK